LPVTPLAERDRIEDALRRVDECDVDPGGTAVDQGLQLTLAELERHAGPGVVSRLIVLTDGETTGEQRCRQLAQQAAPQQIRLTLMGVGTEWQPEFLKELATLGDGTWQYVDAGAADGARRAFAEAFRRLGATGFGGVELHLRPAAGVRVKRVRQMTP